MSINSSSFPTIVLALLSSNSTVEYFFDACMDSMESKAIYTIYTLLNLVLFPLYVFIFTVGFQQWRRQRTGPAGTMMSHSDFFTFQMMIVEILGVLGSSFYTLGVFIKSKTTILFGLYLFNIIFPGQNLFHVFTCVERYLAVVHAITYVHTRETVKLTVRNISTISVWLLSFGWVGLIKLYMPNYYSTPLLPFITFCLFVTLYCCLSVLCFLTRPRPGEVNGNNPRVDPSKKRAFNMIVAITATLLLRMLGILVCFGLTNLISLDLKALCVVMDSGICLMLPSSLVLPALFLHRAGKLPCHRRNSA